MNKYTHVIFIGRLKEIYLCSDIVCKILVDDETENILYPTKFLNSLKFNSVPNHDLKLKICAPIILLRNINQSTILCNGLD